MKKSILVLTPALLLMLSACKLPFFPTSQGTTSDAGSQTTSETTSQGGNTSSGGTTSQGGNTSSGGTTSQGGNTSSGGTTSQGGGSSGGETTSQGGGSSEIPQDAHTITKTIDELAQINNWTTSAGTDVVCYKEFALDTVITISTSGADNCGSVWGTENKQWRLYQNKQGDVTVSASADHELVAVKFTFVAQNNATLLNGQTSIESDSSVSISGSSSTFTVGNSGTKTDGQIRITAISVTYTGEGGDVPPTPGPIAPTSITVTPANASIEQGKTQQFSAALAPQGATGTVTWSVKDANEGSVTKVSVNDSGLVSVAADAPEGSYKVYATVGEVSGSATFTVTEAGGDVPPQPGEGSYSLVTDATSLKAGDVIVITNDDSTVGMKAYDSGNNCKGTAITASEGNITSLGEAAEITLSAASNNHFYMNDGAKYLYAASSSGNQLKGKDTTDDTNGVWAFTYSTDHMSIVATGSSNRNVMQFNPNNGSPVFACYASASQTNLQVYLKSSDPVTPAEATDISISPNEASVKQGASQEFSATLAPQGATGTITWSVAKKNASDDGKVTLSATTGASVTASVANDATVDAVYTLTATCGQLTDSVEITILENGSTPTPQPGENVTVSVLISEYATTNSWANDTQYPTVSLDSNISLSAAGGEFTGKYFSQNSDWRMYQSDNGSLTINAASGYALVSVTFTFTTGNSGLLKDGSTNLTSGQAYQLSGSSKSFSISKSGTGTNGQIKITAISVTYTQSA